MTDEWHVGDPADWGDSIGVPDIPYMRYLNGDDDEDPQYPEVSGRRDAMKLKDEAWKLRNEGSSQDALFKINNAIELYDKEAGFYNVKAIILEDLGDWDEALRCYDIALKMRKFQLFKDNKARLLGRIADFDSYRAERWDHGLECINEAISITNNKDDWKTFLRTKSDILEKQGKAAESKVCICLANENYEMIDRIESQSKILTDPSKTFICIAGTQFYDEKVIDGDIVDLVVEPYNKHDRDAIRVDMNGQTVGYVANSQYTLVDGVKSASEIRNLIEPNQKAEVMFIYLDEYLIAKLI